MQQFDLITNEFENRFLYSVWMWSLWRTVECDNCRSGFSKHGSNFYKCCLCPHWILHFVYIYILMKSNRWARMCTHKCGCEWQDYILGTHTFSYCCCCEWVPHLQEGPQGSSSSSGGDFFQCVYVIYFKKSLHLYSSLVWVCTESQNYTEYMYLGVWKIKSNLWLNIFYVRWEETLMCFVLFRSYCHCDQKIELLCFLTSGLEEGTGVRCMYVSSGENLVYQNSSLLS